MSLRLRRLAVVLVLASIAASAALAPASRADGDPGSDVLVYQDLFADSDAGLSVPQQLQLSGLLKTAARAGFPVRVAIIASPFDLGSVTALWRDPREYARFLGLELSLAYKGRLLVVMPNGFGFNWPGHAPAPEYAVLAKVATGTGAGDLFTATQAAVRDLASAGGIKLRVPAGSSRPRAESAGTARSNAPVSSRAGSADNVVGIVALVLVAIAVVGVAARRALRKRVPRTRRAAPWPQWRFVRSGRLVLPGLTVLMLAAAVVAGVLVGLGTSARSQADALATNPYLDPGTPLSGPAPDFTLADQFGQPTSLRSFRGKVVMLAFNDSECTTVCPLTTTAMLDAKAMLGKDASRVQLLGIDANPAAISLEDVWSYSELHGMLHAWHFLTGSLDQLKRVWRQYGVEAAAEHGQITHTPALFVIGPQGREVKTYITQMSYTAVGQLGQLLAQEASSLLPDHPAVRSNLSYTRVQPITPSQPASLPRAGGGTVRLGPGRAARLFVYFATWDQETSGLAGQLGALNRYQTIAARSGLPQLTAVDEASVEPASGTLAGFLRRLPSPLSYPVAIDRSGKVGDGYEVLGLPWFVLVSRSGRILYYREVSTAGWPSTQVLIRYVRAALARAPQASGSVAAVRQDLAGSPPPLAALHHQATQLLGGEPALAARLRALRGYPVVINAWASWCGPCRSEFTLFASASQRYGRQVAFLGADTNDSAGDARGFLAHHPVSYPSYQTTTSNLSWLAAIGGLPTTIYISPAGKVRYVHIGQYDSQGTLDQDIASYVGR
jgi:cytochrome c biogenesis protein CcmG/thiol:disulfide interchange protein DsbE